MDEVVPFAPKTPEDEEPRGGGCPECRKSDGYLNIESVHYGLCRSHGVFWFIGWNLFSGWQDESYGDWKQNLAILDKMRQVGGGPLPGLLPEAPGPEECPFGADDWPGGHAA